MEQAYLDLGRKLLEEGHRKEDRTGTGTVKLIRYKWFDLQKGFNNETSTFWIDQSELLWFLKGDTISAI